MSYPTSPFPNSFDSKLVTQLVGDKSDIRISKEEFQKTCKWLCSFPKITTYRVNTLKCKVSDVEQIIRKYCHNNFGCDTVNISVHPLLSNVIIVIHSRENEDLGKYEKEIIIDVDCATAVLRGAHIYAPGVKAMMSGSQMDEKVSVFVDTLNKCKRGLQKCFDEEKLFIGNGLVKMQRHQLFSENNKISGVAIEIQETISGCPSIGDSFLPLGWALLQNLPSVLCVLALNPKPGDTIIDLCAAPGNKTTHIAELMNNEGLLVAIDKTPKKVAQLQSRCEHFGAKVLCFQADSTKIVADSIQSKSVTEGLPFSPATFDRVLLDAPCSVMGKRPQIVNRLTENEIKSYVPLQRKLFETAVKLLKINGTLIYSTCTITLSENEGIVAWALKKFQCLELVAPDLSLAGPGWIGTSLTEDQRAKVQRFGPGQSVDSVGFFFACFIKKC